VVTVETLVQTDLFETLSYPAVVKAKIHATILAEADGVVRNIHVPLGQRVHLGQNILTIQQTDPIYQYAPVQVRAPVVGAISQLAVTVGARVSKGQILASVTEPRSVKLGLEIPAQDLSLLKVGMQGIFEVLGTDTTLKIRVVGVSPLVDTATGTASAELEPMEETHKIIYPGRVGRVSFKANQHQGMMLTDSALIVENSKTFVRVVREGKAIKIPVITGLRTRGKVEILSGVEIGEHIIARSSGYIREGAEVQVEEDSSSTSSL
jgi:membrane fusion protein (multidrug efflux system)